MKSPIPSVIDGCISPEAMQFARRNLPVALRELGQEEKEPVLLQLLADAFDAGRRFEKA